MKRRYLLAKALAGKAPSEILIFGPGTNPSYSGPIVFDSEAAAAVMAAFKERGIRLHFDYAHARPHALESATANVDPQYQKAAGWFDLEVREVDAGQELWATNITWAPAAKRAIEDLEWGYFSPWCDVELSTGRVVEVRNIALTNDPAMLGIDPLVSLTADKRSLQLSNSLSFEDINKAIRKALSAKIPDGSPYIDAIYDDTFVYELNCKMYRRGYSLIGVDATLGDEVEEVLRVYEPIIMSRRPRDERKQTNREPSATEKGSSTMERAALILALGLKPDATEAEVASSLNSAIQSSRSIVSLTGASTVSEALGRLEGWSEAAKKLEESQAKVLELEKGAREARVNELIAKGIAEKKVTVAMEANLRAIGLDDPDRLKGLIETLPAVLTYKQNNIDESAGTANASNKKWEELSHTQRANLKRTNPELAKAIKADYQTRLLAV